MKKLLSLLLALSLLLSLAACASVPETPVTETISTTVATESIETTAHTPPETTEPDKLVPPETQPVQTDPPETRPVQTDPPETQPVQTDPPETQPSYALDPNGSYTTKEDVALYIHLYGKLPGNFITKAQARTYGWKKGSLERYAPGKCIGGDVFYNREGQLPMGHDYFECDIGTLGSYSSRGSKRIVFSSDGLVYYTDDHYRTFTLLYGEP